MSPPTSTIPADDVLCEPAPSLLAGRLRSGSWILVVGLALLVATPVLLPPVLPLTDLGGHLGRYAVQLDGGRDPVLAQWYTFRWLLIPNLGVDLLVQLLGPMIGLEPAIRIVVAVAAFLQAFGLLAVSRVVHGRITPFAIAALPLVYAFSFLYGFLNYTLSLGLLWCSLALWIAMSERSAIRRRWVVFALIATVVWTCHLVGWALLCIAAGSQELVRQLVRKGKLTHAAVASVGQLTCLLAPWAIKLLTFQSATDTGKTEDWFLMGDKLAELSHVFQDQWYYFDIATLAFVCVVIVGALIAPWTRVNRALALAAIITGACVIIVPKRLLGSFFADQRLIEPALLFALLSIGLSGRAGTKVLNVFFTVAILFAGTRVAGSTLSLWQLGRRADNDLRVLAALPPNAQLVSFRARRCPPPKSWIIDRLTHLSGYAIARRHAFSNDQWEMPGAQLLRVHNRTVGQFEIDDSQTVYEKHCAGRSGVVAKASQVPTAVSYLWVIWTDRPKPLLEWEPVARHDRSILYRRNAATTTKN